MPSPKITVSFKELPEPKPLKWDVDEATIAHLRTNQQFIRGVCRNLPALCQHPDPMMVMAAIWHLTEKAGGQVTFSARIHVDRGFQGGCIPVLGDITGMMSWGLSKEKTEVMACWESHVGFMGYAPPPFDLRPISFFTREDLSLVAGELGKVLTRELDKLGPFPS